MAACGRRVFIGRARIMYFSGLACADGATYRIGDCPGASGFGDGIRKVHSKMKYDGKAT
jgi:hypothetical protein